MLHEEFVPVIGAILAGIALILSIYVFKRSLDFQAYRELDSNYMDILKISLQDPYLRNPQKTSKYKELPEDKRLKYETYAYLIWTMCETIYDRKKVDKTWRPVLVVEKNLHFEWLKDKENKSKFKDEFIEFIEEKEIRFRTGFFPT